MAHGDQTERAVAAAMGAAVPPIDEVAPRPCAVRVRGTEAELHGSAWFDLQIRSGIHGRKGRRTVATSSARIRKAGVRDGDEPPGIARRVQGELQDAQL